MNVKYRKIISGNAKIVRDINRSTILNLIRLHQPVTRVRLSHLTGLNKSTVSNIVHELLQDNLLSEEELKDQNVGRNPILLRLKPGHHYVAALNLDAVYSRVAVFDINGKMVGHHKFFTDYEHPEKNVLLFSKSLKKMMKKLSIEQINGIGVSVAGMVDSGEGSILYAPHFQWKNLNLMELFQKYYPQPIDIKIDNDANASALAELWFGKGEVTKLNDFVFLSVGAGIGSGIVLNRKILEGANHSAGEFGHMTLVENGLPCICGNRGCLEAYASDRATARRYNALQQKKNATVQESMVEEIIPRALQGEKSAIRTLKETGHFLGLGIKNIIRAVDPQAVIIGGKIIQAWSIIYPEILRVVKSGDLYGLRQEVKILPSSLKVRPRLLGAATLAIREIFEEYQIVR